MCACTVHKLPFLYLFLFVLELCVVITLALICWIKTISHLSIVVHLKLPVEGVVAKLLKKKNIKNMHRHSDFHYHHLCRCQIKVLPWGHSHGASWRDLPMWIAEPSTSRGRSLTLSCGTWCPSPSQNWWSVLHDIAGTMMILWVTSVSNCLIWSIFLFLQFWAATYEKVAVNCHHCENSINI